MQTQHVGPASGTRGRMMEPAVEDDEYIRTLCRAILTRVSAHARVKPAMRLLREDLAWGVVDAYRWHDMLRALPEGDASVRSAIRAVILAINRTQ